MKTFFVITKKEKKQNQISYALYFFIFFFRSLSLLLSALFIYISVIVVIIKQKTLVLEHVFFFRFVSFIKFFIKFSCKKYCFYFILVARRFHFYFFLCLYCSLSLLFHFFFLIFVSLFIYFHIEIKHFFSNKNIFIWDIITHTLLTLTRTLYCLFFSFLIKNTHALAFNLPRLFTVLTKFTHWHTLAD